MVSNWIAEVVEKLEIGQVIDACPSLKRGSRGSLGPCLLCNAERRGSNDRRRPLGVTANGRGWHCHKCKESGDSLELYSLAKYSGRIRDLSKSDVSSLREQCVSHGWLSDMPKFKPKRTAPKKQQRQKWSFHKAAPRALREPEPPPDSTGPFGWRKSLPEDCASALFADDGASVLAYLIARGFKEETLREWGVGAHVVRDQSGLITDKYVAIPVRRKDGVAVNMRFRSVPGTCLRCAGAGCRSCDDGQVRKVYLRCKGAPSTLFGVDRLSQDTETKVKIVEGELDVIALWQYGFKENVVSGTAGAASFLSDWIDYLEPYQHHVIAYDDDDQGSAGAEKLAKSLGVTRCSRARFQYKDAAECLREGVSQAAMHKCIDEAAPFFDINIVRIDQYEDEIENLIQNPDDMRGLPTGSNKLDDGIGGWRPGLVIVTGDTAAGKTSFVTHHCREQAMRGVPTLLTSFEQQPIGNVQKLLRSHLGGDFTNNTMEERRSAMRELGRLPLHILKHYGELDTDECLKAIDYAVRRLSVRFVVVDHLGFLTNNEDDERKAAERAVRSYALAAVQWGVTILMICHPNNLSIVQQRRVKLSDCKGASAIRQDAHVGLVLERLTPGRVIKNPATAVYVDKCRAEWGMMGARLVQYYDPEACVYADTWEQTPMGASGVR